MLYKIETAKTSYYIRQLSLSQRYVIYCETVHSVTPLSIKGYRYPGNAEHDLLMIQKVLMSSGDLDYIPGTSTKMYSCYADLPYMKKEDKFTEINPREHAKKWYV